MRTAMRGSRKQAFTGFGIVLLLVLGFVVYFFLTFKTVVVSGVSMLPTFRNGQRVLVGKAYWLIGPIRDGDVVVIREESPQNPDGYIIKRVYRMAGEVVDWINVPRRWRLAQGEFKVPEGTVYVLGDNREQSEDSRSFGPVDRNRILGKVVVRP